MNRVLKSSAELALTFAPRRSKPGDRLVLAYHNVVAMGTSPSGDRSLHLSEDDFESQLKQMQKETDIVPLQELLLTINTKPKRSERLVSVTFDDAYASAMGIGLQLCQRYNVSATVFVAPGLLGTVPLWDCLAESGEWTAARRHQFLWEQAGLQSPKRKGGNPDKAAPELEIATLDIIKGAITNAIHSIGNHTFDHCNLGALGPTDAIDQIERSADWLRSHFADKYVPILAYPYGIPPENTGHVLSQTSTEFAMKVDGGWIKDSTIASNFMVPRWNVPSGITTNGFRLRLRGWFGK